MDPLSSAASVITVVQISKEILTACGKYALDVKDAKKDIERLSSEVKALHGVLNRVKDLAEGQDTATLPTFQTITAAIAQCLSELVELKTHLDPGKKRQAMNRLGLRALKWPFKSEDVNKLLEALERHKATINLALTTDQSQLIIGVDRRVENLAQGVSSGFEYQHLSNIPCADGAAFNSRLWEHESQCLPETRVDILQRITTWSQDPHSACIFWLNGVAGTGKSTIARTVAHTWAAQKRLGASFFFSKGRGDLGHAAKFFTTLAAQFANALPDVRPYICRAIEENADIFQRGLSDQWKYLIIQPLSHLKETSFQSQAYVLVIDALDECEGEDDIRLMLRFLAEAKNIKTVRLRIFITSRPETPIRFGFRAMSDKVHEDFVLHNISLPIIEHDISIFLKCELHKVQVENGLSEGWPGEDTIKHLTVRASGLFIYASTACRFIQDPSWDPKDSLDLLLKDDYVGQSTTRELDDMYTRLLMHSIVLGDRYRRNQEKLSGQFRRIVGSIVILFDTLPITMLASLLDMPESTVVVRLRGLHSVLDVPEGKEPELPVRLLHPSFRDFLLDNERCLDQHIWIDSKKAHGDLFMSCLSRMSKHLQRDMGNLRLPGALSCEVDEGVTQSCLPLDIQYACCYWVSHLQRSNVELCDNSQVHIFLQEHFLHWLEALSLLGKISDGVLIVRSLESMLAPKSDANHDLHTMVYDAKRFVLNNRSIIETSPLQIYCSALVFSPSTSWIRCQFWDQNHWIKSIPAVQEDWNPVLQSLEGHSDMVNAVVFSPDGQLLASASDDKTIRLWDPSTGASRSTLEGHTWAVNAVSFSPDCQLLASASHDTTVKLWDPSTGSLCSTLEGHSYWVFAVAFSSDGQFLASASADGTVIVWDPLTGALRNTLTGHSDSVMSVAFSPDSRLFASASYDSTVKLWDPSTGALSSTLEGHSGRIYAVSFSPDGQLLASACYNNTVKLWDPSTGALRGTLRGHSNTVKAVAFSSYGQLLASASEDSTIKLWDTSTGVSYCTLEEHPNGVNAVTFSPDGQLLASASREMSVLLWDPSRRASRGLVESHSDKVNAVVFSPDGQLLASASDDKTVRIWDSSTGASRNTLEGHVYSVNGVAFSPDGQLLASASMDSTVKLWHLSTGAWHGTLRGHCSWVLMVVFSPDGQLLVSASNDRTVRLWDPWTGASCGTLEGHTYSVNAVAFSPDGQLLASVSDDMTAKLWDPSTRSLHSTLEGHSDWVFAVAFSPDGKLLASASRDNTVRMWDIKAKETIQILHTEQSINTLSFSSDGSYLMTSQGILEVQPHTHFKSRSLSNSSSCPIGISGHWVRCGTENILWLPLGYRATCQSIRQNVLAIGHLSGRVTFIEFDPETIPLASVL